MKKLIPLFCIVVSVLSACKQREVVTPQRPLVDVIQYIYTGECPEDLKSWNNDSLPPQIGDTVYYLASAKQSQRDHQKRTIGLAKIFQGPKNLTRFYTGPVEYYDRVELWYQVFYGGCSGEFECFYPFDNSTYNLIINLLDARAVTHPRLEGYVVVKEVIRSGPSRFIVE